MVVGRRRDDAGPLHRPPERGHPAPDELRGRPRRHDHRDRGRRRWSTRSGAWSGASASSRVGAAPVTPAADVVVCGAGIAGVAAAYHLAARHGVRRVVLVDERPPLSLTSDKSTEAYRNFWPGPDDAMVRFMNRSIDLLEQLADASGNVFRMNRRGYVFGTADPARAAELREMAEIVAGWGAGPLRVHDGCPGRAAYPPPSAGDWRAQPAGIDLLLDRALIRHHFPYVADDTVALLHARRCGWLSGQQLGMHLLERRPPGWSGARRRAPRRGRGRRRAGRRRPNRRARRGPVARHGATGPRRGPAPARCRAAPRRHAPRVLGAAPQDRDRGHARSGAARRPVPDLGRRASARVERGGARRAGRRSRAALDARSLPAGRPHPPRGAEPGEPDAARPVGVRLRAGGRRLSDAGAAALHGARAPRDGAHGARLLRGISTGCRERTSTAATTRRPARTGR